MLYVNVNNSLEPLIASKTPQYTIVSKVLLRNSVVYLMKSSFDCDYPKLYRSYAEIIDYPIRGEKRKMARVVKCPKCGELGSLQPKKIKHTIYWRVGHYIGLEGKTRKVKWCYIGKELPELVKKQLITQKEPLITQEFTQNDVRLNNLKLSSNDKKNRTSPCLPVLRANTRQRCMLGHIC